MKHNSTPSHSQSPAILRKCLILFTMLLTVVLSARAQEFEVGDLRYICISRNEVAVTGYIGELADVVIPQSVVYDNVSYTVTNIIGASFKTCESLTSVIIPNSVTSIGVEAFAGCSSLASVTIPNSVTSIGERAFAECTSLASVTILDSVTSIRYETFANCTSLASVTIPNSVTSIGERAFVECSSLASVTIPNSVTSIGVEAFAECTSLASVTIPNSVTSIRRQTFVNCTSLASVTIPNSVTSIGICAFWGCSSLISVTIPNSVTSIEVAAFGLCKSLEEIIIEAGNLNYCSDNGILYNKDKTLLIQCPGAKKNVIIPDYVTNIGSYAFLCESLKTIYSLSPTPPSADAEAFFNSYNNSGAPKDAVVYVPVGSTVAYSRAREWNYFSDFREMTNDVTELSSDADANPTTIYNMQGTLVKTNASQADIDALDPGLYIIGGRKVIVK